MRGSAMFRSVLGEVAEGIRSTAEGDLRDLIRVARLPMPLFNASLYVGDVFIARPDAWWPEAGVGSGSGLLRVAPVARRCGPDAASAMTLMCAAGIIPLHFSPRQIRREPDGGGPADQGRPGNAASSVPLLPIRTIPCPESPVGSGRRNSMNVAA